MSNLTTEAYHGNGLIPITIAALRRNMPKSPEAAYWILDKGKAGIFQLDPTDTTSVDNTGQCIVSANGLRFTRRGDGILRASHFGLIPNDNSPETYKKNSDILDTMIKLDRFGHVLLDVPGAVYYIGHRPVSRVWQDYQYCIDLIDFSGIFEYARGVVTKTESGYSGIQINRINSDCNAHLINVTLDGQLGKFTDYKRTTYVDDKGATQFVPIGKADCYSVDWGDYKQNGINLWATTKLTDLTVMSYAGNGVCQFGMAGNSGFIGPVSLLKGTIQRYDNVVTFYPEDPKEISKLALGMTVNIDGNTGNVGANDGTSVAFSLDYGDNRWPKAGSKVTIKYYKTGGPLVADSVVLEGINNIGNCGACGWFTSGNEANQSTLANLRVGNTGGPGIADGSLLKNLWIAPHMTQTGEHFVERFPDGSHIFHQPSFTNRGDQNVGSTLLHPYYEEGNQAPADAAWGTLSLGGVVTMGMNGGHGFVGRQLKDVYIGGQNGNAKIEVGGEGLRFDMNDGRKQAILSAIKLPDTEGATISIDGKPVATK